MKLAHIDEDNMLLGWYDTNLHKEIPEPNIKVSSETWKAALKINANFYDDSLNEFIWKDLRTEKEVKEDLILKVTEEIENLIQSKIEGYNLANNMQFRNIDSVAKYLIYPDYAHFDFCKKISDYNLLVWETARTLQDSALKKGSIPTSSEILSQLPIFGVNE